MTAKQLQNIIKDTESLIRKKEQMTEDYQSSVKKFNDLISKELKGVQEARNELQDMIDNFKSEANETRGELEDRLEDWLAVVDHVSEVTAKPLTQDDLAELTVLGMITPTIDEMEKYANKYRNSPLALQLIEKIAKEKTILLSLPLTRNEIAKSIVSTMKMNIQYHSRPDVNLPPAHISMVAEGDISRHQQLLKEYADLEKEIKKA